MHQDPGERRSDPTRDWPRLAHECPGVSSGGLGQQWPAAGSGAPSEAVRAWDLLKEVTIIFITSAIVWPQVKQQRENTALPINRKLDEIFTERGPRTLEQDPVSPTVSLSHQEASISFLSLLSEGRQNENHNHSKLIKLITWTTALSNSVDLWAMSCRSTYDRRVLLESSDKMWSPGEGNGKLLQHSCLENPMNSITFILSLFNNGHLDFVATKLGKTPNSLQPSNQEVFREKKNLSMACTITI